MKFEVDAFGDFGGVFEEFLNSPRFKALIEAQRRLQQELTPAEWRALMTCRGRGYDPQELLNMEPNERREALAVTVAVEGGLPIDEIVTATLNARTKRRTRAEIFRFRLELYRILARSQPMTVRQVFYQMVRYGLRKTEDDYVRVQQELVRMRRGDALPSVPYGWITDSTRWMRAPNTWESLDDYLTDVARSYRKDYWASLGVHVEVWLEKDALAGVVIDVTYPWGVPLMVTRGFSSVSYLYEAAEVIKAQEKSAFIYLLYDSDSYGRTAARKVEEGLRKHAPDADITCKLAAVTPDQITEYDLPTRPEKKGKGRAVELDALPPEALREIVTDCIVRHIDPGTWDALQRAEQQERETLLAFRENFSANGGAR